MSKRKRSILACSVIYLCISAALVECSPIGQLEPSPENEEQSEEPEPPNKPEISHLVNVRISGIRIESNVDSKKSSFLGYNAKRHSVVKPNEDVKVVIFGTGFSDISAITFTGDRSCQDIKEFSESEFLIMTPTRLALEISFPKLKNDENVYNLCIAERVNKRRTNFVVVDDQFSVITTSIPSKSLILPMWLLVPILTIFLCLSGTFSGLNLGLMTLTPYELQLYIKSGTPNERICAEKILPVRKKGNILLCTLLLGNVVVNSAISLLLDDLIGNGMFALIGSSIGIVIFGEIVPQAICVKRGLSVGAATVGLTRVIMFLMYPITSIIAMILDYFLKEELTQPLGRKKLVEMMKMSTMVGIEGEGNDDFKMALGALEIIDKTAKQAMTKIEDVFMLPSTLKLGPATVNQILEMGYTRIPIYENDRNNVVDLLFIKDLALLDPDDNMDVLKVCSVYKHQVRMVDESTPLRILLDEFKKGEYHLAMVHRVVCKGEGDPTYELVGLITLEDIIEEIIQCEILDETDAVCDNVNRKKRLRKKNHDMSQLVNTSNTNCAISIQMQVVAVQWFSNFHVAFSPKYILPNILEKLIRQHCKKVETTHYSCLKELGSVPPKPAVLYTKGEFSDKFILILEGSAVITIGQESMTLEAGSWNYLGSDILDILIDNVEMEEPSLHRSRISQASELPNKKIGFYPDFNAVVRHECTFVEITVSDWLLAYKATILTTGTPQIPIIRATSRTSLVEDYSSKPTSPRRNGEKPRSCSESEKMELLPKNPLYELSTLRDISSPVPV